MKEFLTWALLFGLIYLGYYHFWGRHKQRPKKKHPETPEQRIARARERARESWRRKDSL
jgi:hypothetical protein